MNSTNLIVPCHLIGVSGHAGAGKDTVAEFLYTKYKNVYRRAFADPLKLTCASLFGMPSENFHVPELKVNADNVWGVSPREMAQFVGTEFVRDGIKNLLKEDAGDHWIRYLAYYLRTELLDSDDVFDSDDTVVIPDVRFQNEYDWIMSNNGIVIHLTRPGASGKVGIPDHRSEAGFTFKNPRSTYEVINDGPLESLHEKVNTIFHEFCALHKFEATLESITFPSR